MEARLADEANAERERALKTEENIQKLSKKFKNNFRCRSIYMGNFNVLYSWNI